MMRGPGATALLARALTASAARTGARIEISESDSIAWHSATFSGSRHAFAASAPACREIRSWLKTIGDTDLPLSGHLLADLSIARQTERGGTLHVRIEALTVERA